MNLTLDIVCSIIIITSRHHPRGCAAQRPIDPNMIQCPPKSRILWDWEASNTHQQCIINTQHVFSTISDLKVIEQLSPDCIYLVVGYLLRFLLLSLFLRSMLQQCLVGHVVASAEATTMLFHSSAACSAASHSGFLGEGGWEGGDR